MFCTFYSFIIKILHFVQDDSVEVQDDSVEVQDDSVEVQDDNGNPTVCH